MIGDFVEEFKNKLDDNILKSIKENDKKLSEITLNIEVVEEIASHINNDTQVILKEIIHDLISGLYSSLQAFYRNAYISLRSGVELSLAYIYFVDHNYDFLFWKQDKYDVKWSVLENEELGVLSKKYLSLFSEDEFEDLFSLCRKIYRDCSQFVHGKYKYMYTVKHQIVDYDRNTLVEYLDMFYELTNVIIALLLIRYSNLNLGIDETYKGIIEKNLKKLQLAKTLEKIGGYWK